MRAPLVPQGKLQAAFSISSVAQLAALFVSIWCLAAPPAAAADDFQPRDICPDPDTTFLGEIDQGDIGDAEFVVCEPDVWNGSLVIFAHGTVDVTRDPCEIESIAGQLDFDGLNIPQTITALGFRFAVLSSCDLGLRRSGKQELIDLVDAVDAITDDDEPPEFIYGIGVSQGSIFAVQLVERSSEVFDGALAACGPIGNFLKQVNYWGDLLVVFDYFFPEFELLLDPPADGSPPPEIVEPSVIGDWELGLEGQIDDALQNNPDQTRQIRRVTRVATDPSAEVPDWRAIRQVLREAVFGANEGIVSLGGNPYDNRNRLYLGSNDDRELNNGVKRYVADPKAIATAQDFETSGEIRGRLVTLHNKWDHRVPFWHELRYGLKALLRGSALRLTIVPAFRFGHCAFKPEEALAAFAILVLQVQRLDLTLDAESILSDFQSRTRFWELIQEFGLTR